MNVKFLKDDTTLSPFPPKVQACLNRGIDAKEIPTYLKNSFNEIHDCREFDESLLKAAAQRLIKTISENKKAFLIVDSDCDGMTSAAHLINYLYAIFPAWVENNLDYGLHKGKQHGINDFVDNLLNCDYSLLLVPDAGTNDIEAIERLHNINCETIILDHHISDVPFSQFAITINSQYNYPNPQLSGVGVVHKFCEYLDILLKKNISNDFKDLTAIGLMGDMMDLRSLETKEMIFEGLLEDNIKNPLIYGLRSKNAFSLSKADYTPSPYNGLDITPMGAAFFIVPFLNALCRSGTQEEKELVFKGMLTMKAFIPMPEIKYNKPTGNTVRLVDRAVQTCEQVKRRQTRAEDAGMELLIGQAEKMLDNKVLLFILEPGEIDPNIAGLVANKLAPKYQRPCCVTIHTNIPQDENEAEREASCGIDCAGSMRGYTATGILNFKEIAEQSSACNWVRGHENAAGISITDPQTFVEDMNKLLKDVPTESVYYVDYIFDADNIKPDIITGLAELNDYLGTCFPRPLVYVKNCKIDNYMIMKDKHLKINTPNCDAVIWDVGEDFITRLKDGELITINFIARCNINEYQGSRKPQLIVEDWEEAEIEPTTAIQGWNF